MNIKLILFSTCLALMTNIYGQNTKGYQIVQKSKQGIPTFIQFDENTGINHLNFQEKLKDEFNFSEENQLVLNSESADKLGFTQYKYNQSYKGITVFGATYIIHEKDNHVKTANGKFFPIMNINTTPTITKEDAIQKAKEQLNITVCRWESKTEEDKLKSKHKNPNATYYPKLILEIVAKEGNYSSPNFRLAWKFNISGMSMDKAWTVFIDAETGELIYKNSLVANDVIGTTTTYYNGPQNINCSFDAGSGYYLLAEFNRGTSANQEIYTLTANNDLLPSSGGDVWNSMQYIGSTTNSFENDAVAGSAHWGIEQAYDFYALFGRNSFDNNGTYILNLVHYGVNYQNAFWTKYDTVMCYGDGDGVQEGPQSALDVVGHEFTHAITDYSANLQYQAESGALNESFSDIFGTGIEYYVLGNNANWLFSEDTFITPGGYCRSLSNPKTKQQPDTYDGLYWAPTGATDSDYGGVHTNSGVQNYWFYLLAAGGSGTNDNGDDYAVNGIGMSDALNIAYRNLTEYLTSTSDYNAAMVGSIQAAIDFWGDASPQVQAVKDAWCAVGVLDCSNVGIKENSSVIQCEVSPNPSDGVFTINVSPQFKAAQLTVQDMVGRTVFSQATDSTQTAIDLSSFPTGIYTLSVKSHNQTVSKKIVVQ